MQHQKKKKKENFFYFLKLAGRIQADFHSIRFFSLFCHLFLFTGEHTDYSGYGVFPMALKVWTTVLISCRDAEEISFFNTDDKFPYVYCRCWFK